MSNAEFAAMLKTEESKRAIKEIIIADIKANGPIRLAMLGLHEYGKDAEDNQFDLNLNKRCA